MKERDRGESVNQEELSEQQRQFYNMSHEFTCYEDSFNTLRFFLTYCPDSLTYLLDRCLVKPIAYQPQGVTYLDLFLFHPSEADQSKSEMKLIETLISMGKDRFLIHPVIEIFLKLKWQKIWRLYVISVLFFGGFFMSLVGYSLTHYGLIFGGLPLNYGEQRTNWW